MRRERGWIHEGVNMLNKAAIKNFGPLPNGEYRFASGLNVVVG